MTDREKAIVMAYTGVCMLKGDKLQIFYEYIEDIMGRSIMTHEIGFLEDEIKEKSKNDFIMLCENEEQEPCEDAISREEAIDACNQSVNILEATDRIKDLPSVYPKAKEQKWIPVSERLPEDKQSVLVWCPQYKNIYCSYREKEQWWIFGAFVQIVPNEVLAWMPLPKPYKAESEEK